MLTLSPIDSSPPPSSLRAAVESGVRVWRGLPVRCDLNDGEDGADMVSSTNSSNGYALLNLAAHARGDSDPWVCWRWRGASGQVYDASCADGRALIVGQHRVTGDTAILVDLALAAMPIDRHGEGSDDDRIRAGRIAMHIPDAMLRAAVLDATDSWIALEHVGTVIDRGTGHDGTLLNVPDFIAPLLIVQCPSTKRRYAHFVPDTCRTARSARLWMMQADDTPEVET